MLDSIAQRFSRSPWLRHILFLGAALVSITIIGYHFGTFDQAIHIPFLKASADPTLFPGDKFFEMRFTHYSYFWYFFLPFYRLGQLEIAMFVVHVVATYLTFWAVWELSVTLFHNPLASSLSVVTFIFPHVGFAGFPLIEFSLLNRTFVLPFLLFALNLFLCRRYLLAFLLLGLMYNLHVISVNFALAIVLFDCLVEFRRVGWRKILLGVGLFVIAALPVLLWKIGSSPIDFSLRPEWLSIMSRGMAYNLFYLVAPYPHILWATLSGLGSIALFFISCGTASASQLHRTVVIFVLGILLVLTVQVITSLWLPVTIIIQSQIIRVGLFGLVFGCLYFANYLAELYQSKSLGQVDFAILAGTFVFATFPFVPVLVWVVPRLMTSRHLHALVAAAQLILFAGGAVVAFGLGIWYPGIYIFAHQTPWYEVQRWARDNTSKDTVFITPPQNWWFYESEWRVFSERRTVVTLSELLEAAFVPEYLVTWVPRFKALAPGALDRFEGDYFRNAEITEQAFDSLSEAALLRVACTYDASYLVVEKPHLRNFRLVYENEDYAVYDLRAVQPCLARDAP